MSGLLVRDQLLVVLSENNNYKYKSILKIPIQQVSQCRILSNQTTIIQVNFIQNGYIYDPNSTTPILTPGIAIAGDSKIYYTTNTNYITDVEIEIKTNLISGKNFILLFQFI